MDTENAIVIAVAAGAFGTALLAVITQWLKADDVAAEIEQEVRKHVETMGEMAVEPPPQQARQAASESLVVARLADDETALSRLFLGWGTAGMLIGLALGAAISGPVGALLGGVVAVAVAVGLVVVGVIVADRVRVAHAKERKTARAAPTAQPERALAGQH